jgi:hypothetical protein
MARRPQHEYSRQRWITNNLQWFIVRTPRLEHAQCATEPCLLLFRPTATEKGDNNGKLRGEKSDPELDVTWRAIQDECKPGAGRESFTSNHDCQRSPQQSRANGSAQKGPCGGNVEHTMLVQTRPPAG